MRTPDTKVKRPTRMLRMQKIRLKASIAAEEECSRASQSLCLFSCSWVFFSAVVHFRKNEKKNMTQLGTCWETTGFFCAAQPAQVTTELLQHELPPPSAAKYGVVCWWFFSLATPGEGAIMMENNSDQSVPSSSPPPTMGWARLLNLPTQLRTCRTM